MIVKEKKNPIFKEYFNISEILKTIANKKTFLHTFFYKASGILSNASIFGHRSFFKLKVLKKS